MPDLPSLRDVVDFLQTYYLTYGYAFVFAGSLLENIALVSFVWPGGVIVLLGAVYARLGDLSLPLVIGLAWIGSFAGTLINYALGRCSAWLPLTEAAEQVTALMGRIPPARWLTTRVWPEAAGDEGAHLRDRIEWAIGAAVDRLKSNGTPILIGSQATGHARNLIAVASGAACYPLARFACIQAAGTLVSSCLIGAIGYLIGENIDLISAVASRLNIGLVVLILALWILRRRAYRIVGVIRRG
ncbi:MAG TPA: hypothetical protein VHL09_07400 [Dehalococcoidia bacterium]|nr:hypothetical protein [Dehalococcoidia bacterium]